MSDPQHPFDVVWYVFFLPLSFEQSHADPDVLMNRVSPASNAHTRTQTQRHIHRHICVRRDAMSEEINI